MCCWSLGEEPLLASYSFSARADTSICLCCCTAGADVVSAAYTIQSGGKGSSGRKGHHATQQEWIPLLPEACSALMAVLVQEHECDSLQGTLHAVQLLLYREGQQARVTMVEQQKADCCSMHSNRKGQARSSNSRKAAAGKPALKHSGSSNNSSGPDTAMPLVSLPVLKALLAACVDAVTIEQDALAAEAAAFAAANAVADLLQQMMGCSLEQLLAKHGPGEINSMLPALLVPDAEAYSLLVQLFGLEGSSTEWLVL